jgi:hypothetical protein
MRMEKRMLTEGVKANGRIQHLKSEIRNPKLTSNAVVQFGICDGIRPISKLFRLPG